MDNQDSLMPPKDLVEKWKQKAYREHGCSFTAYDFVLESAAKWGYRQAIQQVWSHLESLPESLP